MSVLSDPQFDIGPQRAPENPPAFPNTGNRGIAPAPGMTLRDWLAGQALAGAMANQELLNSVTDPMQSNSEVEASIAEVSYRLADALLSERVKNTGEA